MNINRDQIADNIREPAYREAQLLLRELQHRTANEIASAVAAMRLAQNAGVSGPKAWLFDRAIERLEGFGVTHSVLSAQPARMIDMGAEMHRLCRGLLNGRSGLNGSRLRLSVDPPLVPGGPAHRILLIAAELLYNSIRHALIDRGGDMTIEVRSEATTVSLTVSDNGPGFDTASATSGTRLGANIVSELVRAGGGFLACDSDRKGTTIRVTLPLSGPSPIDWAAAEGMS